MYFEHKYILYTGALLSCTIHSNLTRDYLFVVEANGHTCVIVVITLYNNWCSKDFELRPKVVRLLARLRPTSSVLGILFLQVISSLLVEIVAPAPCRKLAPC